MLADSWVNAAGCHVIITSALATVNAFSGCHREIKEVTFLFFYTDII